MKALLKNRARLWMETLEDRTAPAISVLSGTLPDANGNLNVTLNTSGTIFNVIQSGANQITLSDNALGSLVINNVFGNITVNAKTTQAAAFAGNLNLNGTLTGNVSITLGRAAGATQVDFAMDASGASNILGNLTVNVNSPTTTLADLTPASATTVFGNLAVNLTGGTVAHTKGVNLSNLTVNGNVNLPNINVLDAQAATTILGTATVSTKATSAVTNLVHLAATASVGNLSVVMGDVSGTGSSNVNLEGTVNGFATVRLGANTGAATTNQVNLGSGATFNGTQLTIVGGNGSKQINIGAIVAPAARLTVSLGNATDNQVNFLGGASLVSATLIGGLGTNKVTGTVDFPLSLYRFSF
ncbi:MAG: hypothetical protein U0736_17720 [Gemmataceae bacterium]